MAPAQPNIDSLASPAQEIQLAFERGVCASARAPFSRQPSSVGSEGHHQGGWGTPQPKGADLPCTSGTTISDLAKAVVAEREAVESREQGRKLQRHAGGAGRGRKRGSGRGRGRGRGKRRLAVATAQAARGSGPLLRGGGRARIRRIQRAAAVLECDTPTQQPDSAEMPLEAEPAAVHADRILEETLEQCQEVQEAEETAAEVEEDADGTAAAADITCTPEVSPVVMLQCNEPAASEPMLREMYPVPAHSAPARRTRSQPLLLMQRSRDFEEVTSAPPMTSAPQPCSSAGAAAAAAEAPQEPPQVAGNAPAPQCGIAAGAPALQPAAVAAAPEAAGRSEPCSMRSSAQPQSAQPAAAATPLSNPAVAAGPGRPRPASNNSGSGGGSRGGPRKRGRPPQMVPHPHTGLLVPKRDLIKARIDPATGEQRAVRPSSVLILSIAHCALSLESHSISIAGLSVESA